MPKIEWYDYLINFVLLIINILFLMNEEKEITVSIEENQIELKKSRITRILYITGGTLSLALAILGIVLPGLPTTPFALLSAYFYAKSSRKLYNWLLNNKILGPRIKNYHKRNGVTRKGKIGIIIFMWTMVCISSFACVAESTNS